MIKRLLNCSPKEMLALNSRELVDAIRMSEGRTIIGAARVRGPNFIQYVSSPEAVAAFGADIVAFNAYDLHNPIFPGLPSKDPMDDEPYRNIQVQIGKGWTAREVREMIGRPIMAGLYVPPSLYGIKPIDTGFADQFRPTEAREQRMAATDENIKLLIEQGFDMLGLGGHGASHADRVATVERIRKTAGDKIVIMCGVPHGPGLLYAKDVPFNLREIFTPDMAADLVKAGGDIITCPAVGSLPGFTPSHVGAVIDAVHAAGGLADVGIHNSQEGTDVETIKRIAIDNKTLGADTFTLGDAAFNENMGDPEVYMALSIAIKGRRHTYRRMSESVLR
jgi:hypothetical protein